jgi:hypothetical protein
MMLLERWVVATVLGLTMPIVSTAARSSAPQQAGDAQTAQPSKTAGQDPQAAKTDDDQDDDEKPGTSAYDRDTPDADRDPAYPGDDHPATPSQAGNNQDVKPAISANGRGAQTDDQGPAKPSDQDAKPANSANDRNTAPAKVSGDQNASKATDSQDARPAKVAQDQAAQPNKSSDVQNPVKVPEHTLATSPATPEQAEQQQLERDSATLLQLVQELKVEVEKAGSNTLSLAALRKADEIQRLAKNLKEKMKERGQIAQNKP